METKRSTFATSFYIKRSAVRNRDGKAPIMVKISVDGDDKAVGTKPHALYLWGFILFLPSDEI